MELGGKGFLFKGHSDTRGVAESLSGRRRGHAVPGEWDFRLRQRDQGASVSDAGGGAGFQDLIQVRVWSSDRVGFSWARLRV